MTPRPGDIYEVEILTDKLRTEKYYVVTVGTSGEIVMRKVRIAKKKINNIRFPPTIILRYFANALIQKP